MAKVSLTVLRKYLSAINKAREKHLTVDKLSKHIGVYPDIISEHLSMFDPMINMDYDYNVRVLVPQIEEYIANQVAVNKETNEPREVVYKKELIEYTSIQDFIYKKLTVGGIVDKSATLNDHDLSILKKLVVEEQNKRKARSKKSKKGSK